MSIKSNVKHTMYACYLGYITQAVVNSLAPLLFITFRNTYGLTLEQIACLVTVNFGTQLLVDLLAAGFVDRIGYRIAIVGAHVFAGGGLLGLSFLPQMFTDHYLGLIIAIAVYGIGGGLIEVLLSPIVQASAQQEKSSAMCLLHSFNCWGQVLVVLLSTAFFAVVGIERWQILVRTWALLPFFNAVYFSRVPLRSLSEDGDGEGWSLRRLCSSGMFWIFLILMVCSGAAEQSMSQWASAFAELGLGVTKTAGDLAGPCLFALLMGLSRIFYARNSGKINLQKYILVSSIGCLLSYLLAARAPLPILSLVGCGLCGLSIGILWPGVFSMAAKYFPSGGTSMFALLALAGDLGCSAGPYMVGAVSSVTRNSLKTGLMAAALFPALLVLGVLYLKRRRRITG